MMRSPSLASIQACEARVAQSGRNARDGLARAEVAFRAYFARPSTLALAIGAGGILAFWLRRRPPYGAGRDGAARTASTVGLAAAAMLRYGMQYWPLLVRVLRPPGGPR